EAVGGVDLDAFEVVLQDEVDHAGDGVSAVHGRGAAGDGVDALDQGQRDGVGVDHAFEVERHHAAAVDQHQRTVGAQAAQVDGRAAARTVVGGRTHGRHGGRQVLDQLFNSHRLR